MKISPFLIIAFSLLSSCNFIEEKKNDLASSATEKILEKATGVTDVDLSDVNHLDENNAIVDLQIGGKNLKGEFKNAFSSITASKETIAITVTKESEGRSANILLGFTGKDLTALKPIQGNMQATDAEETNFQFSLSTFSENKMESKISKEAIGEIIQLTDKEVIIKVSGKLYSMENHDSPEKWEDYSGTITMKYPVYNAIGVSKEKLNY